jgi:hypothetical protein
MVGTALGAFAHPTKPSVWRSYFFFP